LKRDISIIKNEINRLRNLLNKMLESPKKDKTKILEISHELDGYILKYYEAIADDIEE